MSFLPMPPAKFDKERYFDHIFPPGPSDDEGYREYYRYRFLMNDPRLPKPSKHDIKRFSLHGPWDKPDFSPNERELAWRIECLRPKKNKTVDAAVNTEELWATRVNNFMSL